MSKLISIVGNSATGKSTLQPRLAQEIRQQGYEVIELIEPGPLRDFIKSYRRREDSDAHVETALFSTDRLLIYEQQVFPRWEEENLVFLSNRGLTATLAYQCLDKGVPIELALKQNKHIPKPDLTLCLVVDGVEGNRRAEQRQNRGGEKVSSGESVEAIDRLRGHYETIASMFSNYHIIDTTHLDEEKVYAQCTQHIGELL